MGQDQSSDEENYEAPPFNSTSENGGNRRRRGLHITVEDMQSLGDACFRATGTDGFVYLLTERNSSLFTFVAFLASQKARQGYVHLVMQKRHLASLSKLEPIQIRPQQQQQHLEPLILQMPKKNDLEEEGEEEEVEAGNNNNNDIGKEGDDTDLEGQKHESEQQQHFQTSSANSSLTFVPPPLPAPANIPLLPSPFITGTPYLEGYDELVAYRKLTIPGDFYWIHPKELELFRLLTAARIGETFFMRMCKEYMVECETSPKTRTMSLEDYVRKNELCPYAIFGDDDDDDDDNLLSKNQVNGLHNNMKANNQKQKKVQPKTPPEDAVRQILRAYEVFESSLKASIFTDQLLMLFVSVQKLLQKTIESHGAAETQTASFDVSYADLKEIKCLMDEVKQKLQKSQTHKNCPFKPEDVSGPQPLINNNTNNNIVVLDVGVQPLPPPPTTSNNGTVYPQDIHKMD